MSTPPLTRRQRQILDFFKAYVDEHGMSPTLEEVAQSFGVNKVTVFGHVSELERKGLLKRAAKGISRGLQIVEETSSSAMGSHSETPSSSAAPDGVGPVSILGKIAAGVPIAAIEDPAAAGSSSAPTDSSDSLERLDWTDLIPRDRDVYALRVEGESMIEDGIHDGDLVLVENRTTARAGEMVVAITEEEETTLKRYYPEQGRIRLQPANASMEPIYVDRCEIRGVVIGVVRRF